METQNTIWMAVAILFLVGAAALWIRQRVRLKHARSWPTETGRVESTAIRLEQSVTGQAGTTTSSYVATVHYTYTVQGAPYAGTLRHNFMLKGRAEKWTDKFTTGLPLRIRYNPANPKDSVLFEGEQLGMAA
jgi:hypothetical protein